MQSKVDEWLSSKHLDAEMKSQIEQASSEELQELFLGNLEFGTGGMRGIIGPGPNRMNMLTIAEATRGFADYLLDKYGEQPIKVVIGYDNRQYSKEFSQHVAEVFSAKGITAFLFDKITATPIVSFAIRELGAQAGVIITASHNPPEYNGYKIYDETGCQLLPGAIEEVLERIAEIDSMFEYQTNTRHVEKIDDKILRAYIHKLEVIDPERKAKNISIGFSPQHGTAYLPAKEIFNRYQFDNVEYVEEQVNEDPFFSGTKSANPEEPAAFEKLFVYGEKYDLDILLTTDPDADRVGVGYKLTDNSYRLLTGNQVGALLTDYAIKHKKVINDSYIAKTIVTSELGAEIARQNNVKVFDVLTGFKYIGDIINTYGEEKFICGYEESYGYLVEPLGRDKDGLQVLLVIACMAEELKKKGKTLGDALEALYAQYGYYQEDLIALEIKGNTGQTKIQQIYQGFKNFPLEGLVVKEDFEKLDRIYVDGTTEKIELEQAEVIKLIAADGTWVCARPSGTEPKIKIYFGTTGERYTDTTDKIQKLKTKIKAFLKEIEEEV